MANKLIDIEKLSRYHDNLKLVLNTKEEAGAAAEALEAAQEFATGLVMDGDKSRFDAAGAAAAAQTAAEANAAADATTKANAAEDNAKAYANGLSVNYDAAGAADAAQAAAEKTATDLNAAMDVRVKALEDFDHDTLVDAAVDAAVAKIVDEAESDFDTLKEVADWIKNDTTGAAALQIAVSEHGEAIVDLTNDKQDKITDLETIRTGAEAGAVAEQNAKNYADGAAAKALADAKADAENLYQEKGNYEAAGAAAQALIDAKADAANTYQVKGNYLTASDLAEDSDIDGLFD